MIDGAGQNGGNGPAWRVWVDTGGTFTDCVAVDPGGRVRRVKVLSTGAVRGRVERAEGGQIWLARPVGGEARALVGMRVRLVGGAAIGVVSAGAADGTIEIQTIGDSSGAIGAGAVVELSAGEEAPVLAARLVTGTAVGAALPPIEMRLGTTRGTNALLERRGARVALFVTRGFGDLLEIGTQQRPELFTLRVVKPALLHEVSVEVSGRLDARGHEIELLDLEGVRRDAMSLVKRGVWSAAVALMHSWVNPEHEERVASVLLESGFEHVSVSSRLGRAIKVLPRVQTGVVNAYLAPVIKPYLRGIEAALDGGSGSLRVMTSGGGLVPSREFTPKDSLLSGPAGGVVGATAAGRAAGFEKIIALDMGGTSTDVSRFDSAGSGHELVFEHQVGAASIVAPALAIESVAAGGGSECWLDGEMLAVGPRSAGASPGPACYGAGGPLTITDCNLLLGRLDPASFGVPVSEAPARTRLEELTIELERRSGRPADPDAMLEGFLEVALERMAEAIRAVSVRRGYEPAEYALVAFGGAGGQVACGLASRLGITRVVVPRDAGLLSALGLGSARIERVGGRQVLRPMSDARAISRAMEDALAEAGAALDRDGVRGWAVMRRLVSMRMVGQETSLDIETGTDHSEAALRASFEERYHAMYGHGTGGREIEVEAVRVVVGERSGEDLGLKIHRGEDHAPDCAPKSEARPGARRRARFAGEWAETPVVDRESLTPVDCVRGPALLTETHTTTVVEPGWEVRLDESGALVLESTVEHSRPSAQSRSRWQGVEVSTGRLSSIAREMGEMLRRTALSTNVKERLDFSCAILDARGELIVNAPHVPVHLGSLGVCVRALRDAIEMGEGDVVVTNHPALGGSHLPDVTVVTPVFAGAQLIAYVASRAHHAEIGGIRPGSMPVGAKSLAEEGVVIPPMHLVRAGESQWGGIERILRRGPWPSRALEDNLADLRAQVAANRRGVQAIGAFAQDFGRETVEAAMDALLRRAEHGANTALARLWTSHNTGEPRGAHPWRSDAEEHLDDGSPIRVRIEVSRDGTGVIDFTGSPPVHPGNFNATEAIVRSAVLYVLRLLVDEDLPLNEGLLRGVELRVPEGMLAPRFDSDPEKCPAVAAGNVETSQRIVDTLLKALGVAACSQGTMNNIVFGNDRFGYYETVCGGAGACPDLAGADAVHTHMTNTRITDPEILEHRYPVRLERFEIRRGSGGRARHRGGDGVVRELAFLEPVSLSLITQHREFGPYGLSGGAPGLPGAQRIIRADGRVDPLGAIAGADLNAGDRLLIETPGGGGWGTP